MKERFSYDPFVLPYTIGLIFVLTYLVIATMRVIQSLPSEDRKKLGLMLFSKKLFISIKEIFLECLLHVKIWKKNKVLGYMHSSLAFGWFMLIVLGHFEVNIFAPHRLNLPYFPIFFRYFMMETNVTMKGSLLFFLMDFFLLVILSGEVLAIIKRFRSRLFGMKRTTKLRWNDRIAMYSLWAIFPLRFLAESFTSEISGGSFLTRGFSMIFENFHLYLANDTLIRPMWWAYSIALGTFFVFLPWSRYTHILSEVMLIFLRNAGIKEGNKNKGYAKVEIYSCSRCGLCLDPCQMISAAKLHDNATVNFTRNIRWWNYEDARRNSSYCLMCDRCVQACPVGVNSVKLKLNVKKHNPTLYKPEQYNYIPSTTNIGNASDVLYFAGCMTHLSPAIKKSMTGILDEAKINYNFMDAEGSICCGRPLMQAGEDKSANILIEKNKDIIKQSNAKLFVTSCPICYKVFKDTYKLDIPVMHHTEYIEQLMNEGKIKLKQSDEKVVFHDSCELGRHSGVYEAPRNILNHTSELISTKYDGKNGLCCGNSIASESMPFKKRRLIAEDALIKMTEDTGAETVVTSCPACKHSFGDLNLTEVKDIAEVVYKQMEC